jgi:hypothetical protein
MRFTLLTAAIFSASLVVAQAPAVTSDVAAVDATPQVNVDFTDATEEAERGPGGRGGRGYGRGGRGYGRGGRGYGRGGWGRGYGRGWGRGGWGYGGWGLCVDPLNPACPDFGLI